MRLDSDGKLVIPPLSAEDIPAEARALQDELTEMLPFAPIVSLLIEMDERTGSWTASPTPAASSPAPGAQAQPDRGADRAVHQPRTDPDGGRVRDLLRHPGLDRRVVRAGGDAPRREPGADSATTRAAADRGLRGGTLSSSDGQRFPTRGKSVTARALSRYFAHEGLSTYTHVTDQHTTYGTKIIVATKREAHYVLDEILGNATDIPIQSMPLTRTASPWSTSDCSTCSGCSSRPGSGTWARSRCTGRYRRPTSRRRSRRPSRC